MTPRSLFNIILKILGVFFIKDFLATTPQLLSIFFYFKMSATVREDIWAIVSTLLSLLVYGLVSYFLIFKTEIVIDKLKLDRGFDQGAIPLNIHRSTVLSISIIVIGGLIIADEIPTLCRQLFSYFQERRMNYSRTDVTISYSALTSAKIIIGILLMTRQRQIVNFIERQRKK